jgi:hypothetical protein
MGATTMTMGELERLIHKVDRRHKGCTVCITTVNVPPHGSEIYGVITIGMREYKRIFHNEQELHEILTTYSEE